MHGVNSVKVVISLQFMTQREVNVITWNFTSFFHAVQCEGSFRSVYTVPTELYVHECLLSDSCNVCITRRTLPYQRCSSCRCELSSWWWWYICHRNMSELKWSFNDFCYILNLCIIVYTFWLVITLMHSSLLNGNMLTERSSAADWRTAESGHFNSQQLTERERSHWTFFRSWLKKRNPVTLIHSSLLNWNVLIELSSAADWRAAREYYIS
jgi:hypothetical protein